MRLYDNEIKKIPERHFKQKRKQILVSTIKIKQIWARQIESFISLNVIAISKKKQVKINEYLYMFFSEIATTQGIFGDKSFNSSRSIVLDLFLSTNSKSSEIFFS